MNQTIVFNLAGDSELSAPANLFHAHRAGMASKVGDLIGVARYMSWHDNIAFDSVAGLQRLIQQAVESVPANVPGRGAKALSRTAGCEVNGPVQRDTRASSPLSADMVRPTQLSLFELSPNGRRETHFFGKHIDLEHFPCQTRSTSWGVCKLLYTERLRCLAPSPRSLSAYLSL
jgi:hypothetical protein